MKYKQRKQVRELLKGSRKLHHANYDILPAKDNEQLSKTIGGLDEAYRGGKDGEIEKAVEQVEKQLEKSFPRKPNHWLRENIEVLLVAVVIAMAVRTYFLQPFKIPTGSMMPTLYGIHNPGEEFPPGDDHETPHTFPLSIVDWLVWGKTTVRDIKSPVGWVRRITGDHIFVDKVTYNFRKPKRGEVIVFATDGIKGLDQDKFYIKRCVGVPEDHLEIHPPYLMVNGQRAEGKPFERMFSMQDGYRGYTTKDQGGRPVRYPVFDVPLKMYFACGDNSANSLDSRYWGGVPEKNLVGKALWTYWPFSGRWGLVN